ncbi:MAG: tRNA pseudouridine(55) synthase TruB, partial [Patescibacteria group bacterium]
MDGVLLVDKPAGPTSHDVVASLRRLTGERKLGHTGTLDPIATGLLVLCFGAATKAIPYLPEGDKTYAVEAELGAATDTQDRTGRITAENRDFSLAHADLLGILAGFVGPGTQLPPMYSAVQVGGERLYRLARAGCEVEREARPVEIASLRLDWPSAAEKPFFTRGDRIRFTVRGSRGLYVRTLCHDLGQRAGCLAHLCELRRLASGPFSLDEAVPLAELTREGVAARLWPIGRALAHLPELRLCAEDAARVSHGGMLAAGAAPGRDLVRAVDPRGETFAVLARRGGLWRPERVFK